MLDSNVKGGHEDDFEDSCIVNDDDDSIELLNQDRANLSS